MRDTELYRHLLGLVAPWEVERVELSTEGGRVDVWVTHPVRTRFVCSDCERELSVYDHSEERAWRHLDSCVFLTFLHARPPRIECPEHGVRQARLPWAEPHSRFTTLFERLAIDVLGATDVAAAAGLLRISWDEAWHLMDRAVARGLAAKPLVASTHVGVDEKAAGRGQDYITLVSDLDAGTVEFIADERRESSLDGYFDQFTDVQLAGIEAVAMDMWEPFAASTREHLSDADSKIVFDRYHLMGYLTGAVDTVRKQENRALAAAGDKSLAGSKYLWLYSAENLPAKHTDRFTALRSGDLKTAPGVGDQGEPAPLLVLSASRVGGQALQALVLLGHPLSVETDHRCGQDAQAARGWPVVLLRPSDHQRRRGGPKLSRPSDPGLCPRLPQPGALQDRDLLPPRRPSTLPGHAVTHGLPGSAPQEERPSHHRVEEQPPRAQVRVLPPHPTWEVALPPRPRMRSVCNGMCVTWMDEQDAAGP